MSKIKRTLIEGVTDSLIEALESINDEVGLELDNLIDAESLPDDTDDHRCVYLRNRSKRILKDLERLRAVRDNQS